MILANSYIFCVYLCSAALSKTSALLFGTSAEPKNIQIKTNSYQNSPMFYLSIIGKKFLCRADSSIVPVYPTSIY